MTCGEPVDAQEAYRKGYRDGYTDACNNHQFLEDAPFKIPEPYTKPRIIRETATIGKNITACSG